MNKIENEKYENGIKNNQFQKHNNQQLPTDPFKKRKSFKKSSRNQNQQNQDQIANNNKNTSIIPPKSTKKSTRINRVKQTLSKCLNEVTDYSDTKKQQQINMNNNDQQKDQKNIMFNPICKLTSKPFIRSKTCEQIRKQYSKKKQRKRANSALKYNTPLTNNTHRQNRQNTESIKQKNSSQIVTFKNLQFNSDHNDILQFSLGTNKKQSNLRNKFTPKMQRYQNNSNKNNHQENQQNQQIERTFALKSQQSVKHLDLFFNNNQILTDLQMTNKILQEKLQIKNKQIQQLSKNYNILKNQMYQAKYLKSYQSNSISNQSKNQSNNNQKIIKYYNLQQPYTSGLTDIQHEYTSSPKFNVQEYQPQPHIQLYQHLPLSSQPIQKQNQFIFKNKKRKQLFSSEISQKVSELSQNQNGNENQDNYSICKDQFGENSRFKEISAVKKYSHFRTVSDGQKKKESFILNLKQQIQDQEKKRKKQVNTPQKYQLEKQIQRADSFLLQYTPNVPQLSINQSLNFSQDSKLEFTGKKQNSSKNNLQLQSPSKKVDVFSYYHTTFLNSSIKPSSTGVYNESMKSQYKLTPQKDIIIKYQQQKDQPQQQGLFSKALSANKNQQYIRYPIKQLPKNSFQNLQAANIMRKYISGRKSANLQLNFINKCIQNANQNQIAINQSTKEKMRSFDTIVEKSLENS